jgi:hypothetical protein
VSDARRQPLASSPALLRSYVNARGRRCNVYLQNVVIEGQLTSAEATVCQQGARGGRWELSEPELAAAGVGPRRSDLPCPAPGTIVETSIGGWFQFTRADGPRCWFRTGSGTEESRYAALLGGNSTWLDKGGTKLADLWPLQVGKRTWFIVEGVSSGGFPTSWYETYTVRKRERVTVPAGTFDAYVIEWDEQGREGNGFQATSRYWYAPNVGYFVKFEAARMAGSDLKDWEATRVQLPTVVLPTASAPPSRGNPRPGTPSPASAGAMEGSSAPPTRSGGTR